MQGLCDVFVLDKDNVSVDSPFIGGGFGVELFARADAVLAAIGWRGAGSNWLARNRASGQGSPTLPDDRE